MEPDEALPEEVEFNDADLSWKVFLMMQATNWQHLPMPGSLLEQPEGLMEDVIKWKWLVDTAGRALSNKDEQQ